MLGDNAMKNWLRGKKMSLLQMKFNSINLFNINIPSYTATFSVT